MPISTPVRFFDSTMPNAPQLSGAAGTLRAILDACLVDGFDVKTVNDITISGDVATVNISSGHVFTPLDVIRIEGATPAALNNDWRVVSANGSQLTFDVSGTGLTNGTATGTITAKRAPAGWSKAFAAGDTVVYRTAGTLPDRMDVRIDDTGTTSARIKCFNEATGLSSGVGEFPTEAERAGGLHLCKSTAATTAVRYWAIFADDKFCYFFSDIANLGAASCAGAAFGLSAPLLPGGQSTPFLEASRAAATNSSSYDAFCFPAVYVASAQATYAHYVNYVTAYVGRGIDGSDGSLPAYKSNLGASPLVGLLESGYPALFSFPDPATNALLCTPTYVLSWSKSMSQNSILRAKLPGFFAPLHQAPLPDLATATGVVGVASGTLKAKTMRSYGISNTGSAAGAPYICQALFDVIGPWR